MSSDSLDTGDTPAVVGDLLMNFRVMLVKEYGHKPVKAIRDAKGVYTVIMRDQYGGRYYLIAKGSKLWRDIVSTQSYLPHQAARENTPLVLAWYNPDSGTTSYYLFDPKEIVDKNYGTNVRFGVEMINWSIRLGVRYDPSMSVSGLYEKTKGKTRGLLGFGIFDGSILRSST